MVGAQGVHLGQGDMAPERARAIVGDAAIVGWTAFLPEHFSALAPDVVDYAGTGPFYPTLTKPGKSVLGADGFSDLVAMSPVPVVGIGGIVPENAGAVIRAGAAGVAMMRGISEASDPAQAARNYLLAVEAARRDVRLVG